MRRFAFVLLFLAALPAFAIHPDVARIGVLRFSMRYSESADAQVARAIQDSLRGELSRLGYDAFDTGATIDDLRRNETNADLYIDVVGSRESTGSTGGIALGTPNVRADIGIVVSRVAAEVRVYDGHSLELVRTYPLDRHSTSVMPTAIGAGHLVGPAAVWVTVPVMRWMQGRSAARDVATEAAERIAADFPRR